MGHIIIDSLKRRFYTIPALVLCKSISLIPSYRVRRWVLTTFGRRVRIDRGTTVHGGLKMLVCRDLSVGEYSTINQNCFIDTRFPVVLGKHSMLGSGTQILTLGHDIDSQEFNPKGSGVTIGDDVIVFPNSTILPGITIGDGAVVLTGSVVVSDVSPDTVVGGNPAQFIRPRKQRHAHGFNYKTYLSI